ncbi:sigma-70 family RNA polymerase sigma factor [Colwellia sp. 4_MG-2023]|uniref:RNA polymerase sigma factor n=1 Tax=unclassified Colwellia TaxID=196834 RepID=UPI0026E423F7|nr:MULTISPECIES: sigma-70 family RNA polymerase sigma factor [unclassified Colwellia]MDO6507712.1 sigma-70 family RNA polymerase sigma factor [Colwellia sp. 5_MG-2023]MDO6556314.1 sigma-70 family RNA polymerase sigma factor [Colwellia sp. 4_MG-2023]
MNKALSNVPLFFNSDVKEPSAKSATIHKLKTKSAKTQTIDTLFRDHWLDVCRLLHKCYGSGPPEPEDVAQEAFSRFAQMNNPQQIHDPKAYIIKIAINITLKSIGHLCKAREFITEQLQIDEDQVDTFCPERILQSEQRIHVIQKATEQLTDKQRDILMRARIKGQTYAQIAADTGWSLADICRQLNTAMSVLEAIDEETSSNNNDKLVKNTSSNSLASALPDEYKS